VQVELYLQEYFYESSQSQVVDEDESFRISPQTWELWFQRWLEILSAEIPLASVYEVGLLLTDDLEIQALNAQYRNQNKPTDVLSFSQLEVDIPLPEEIDTSASLYLGDLVISVETAFRQAQQQDHSLLTELAWLASHGLLHLLGWDHPDEDSLSRMLNKQVILLKEIGVSITLE
jgi:probable rRNA maturation factor